MPLVSRWPHPSWWPVWSFPTGGFSVTALFVFPWVGLKPLKTSSVVGGEWVLWGTVALQRTLCSALNIANIFCWAQQKCQWRRERSLQTYHHARKNSSQHPLHNEKSDASLSKGLRLKEIISGAVEQLKLSSSGCKNQVAADGRSPRLHSSWHRRILTQRILHCLSIETGFPLR